VRNQAAILARVAGLILGFILSLSMLCSKGNPVNDNIDNHVYGTLTDIDGNVYKTIQIGNQTWMAENLKTTKYNDGTSIPLVNDSTPAVNFTAPGYCWYNSDQAIYKITYGALYNWHAVNTGKLAPIGWHVPTDSEWTILTTYLGDVSVAGGKLKQTGTSHWNLPNLGATNEVGFSAIGGGYCGYNGAFSSSSINFSGFWWSSTADYYGNTLALSRAMNGSSAAVISGSDPLGNFYSLRCVKD
jgi:uncharacterized protein (TIGR02145 family)